MARRLMSAEAPEGFEPVCPYCEHEIDGLAYRELNVSLGKARMWLCPRCHKVLGVSHRKGFWMG